MVQESFMEESEISQNNIRKCKYYNRRFSKQYQKGCPFFHLKEICSEWCQKSGCRKRHPNTCKYGFQCRFGNKCAYFHPFKSTYSKNKVHNVENKTREDEIERLKVKVILLESKVEESKTMLRILKSKFWNETKLFQNLKK